MMNYMKFQRMFPILVLVLAISSPSTFGDTWGPPSKEHWSANQKWVLKVGWPADKTLSLWEATEAGLKEHWRRGYIDKVWPPHHAYVADDGEYVVLRDVYSNLGHGKVIVILGEQGSILGSYELSDFLPQDDIQQAERTVSSLWWNNYAWFSFINHDRQFALVTQVGTVRCFDLPSGKLLELTADQRAAIVDRVRREAERWVDSEQAGDRIRGVTLLGALRIEAALPTAQKLFQDKTPTGSVGREGRSAKIYAVQEAAAIALTRLMGAEAIPIIEAELSKANWYMAEKLLDVLNRFDTKADGFIKSHQIIETPESAAVLAMWKRLAQHASADIRLRAPYEVLRRDDGTYLLDHPELIQAESVSVRWAAVQVLAKVEPPKAIPLLRKAITDKNEDIRSMALLEFVARQPPDIEEVLLPYLQDECAWIRWDVICELASRGNPAATDKLRETIATWPEVPPESEKTIRRREIETLCKLVADLRLEEVEDSLSSIRSVSASPTRVSVTGALAALGDEQALHELHQLARSSGARDLALAIEMCRYLDDEESAALVRQAAQGKDDALRHAATKELLKFKDRRRK